jgi:riboflavin biosynthesis pyrimidine reductase
MSGEGGVFPNIDFPEAPPSRPYTFIDMVSTIDGKTISGTDKDPVEDLGSKADHDLLRRLEGRADAILTGAGNLRSVPGLWYPKDKIRAVATNSGHLNYKTRFFTDAPEKVLVLAPEHVEVPKPYRKITNDFTEAFRILREELGVHVLAVEGGSNLNGQLLPLNLIDELFLTLSPKVKLGECLPTYAGGEPLPKGSLQKYELLDLDRVGDEVFLRYKRNLA